MEYEQVPHLGLYGWMYRAGLQKVRLVEKDKEAKGSNGCPLRA